MAESQGELVGVAVACPDADQDGCGELRRLYVEPDDWGRGTARVLHDAVLQRLRHDGFARAGLWVLEANRRARSMYERWGWSLVPGQVKGWPDLDVIEIRYERGTRGAPVPSPTIDAHMAGRPDVALGGYVAGVLAGALVGPAKVDFLRPVAVGRSYELRDSGADEIELVDDYLVHGADMAFALVRPFDPASPVLLPPSRPRPASAASCAANRGPEGSTCEPPTSTGTSAAAHTSSKDLPCSYSSPSPAAPWPSPSSTATAFGVSPDGQRAGRGDLAVARRRSYSPRVTRWD